MKKETQLPFLYFWFNSRRPMLQIFCLSRLVYIGEFSMKNATNYLCNAAFLTCLGQVIEIERIPSVLRRPRWPRKVSKVILHCNIADIFACKHQLFMIESVCHYKTLSFYYYIGQQGGNLHDQAHRSI